MSGLSQKSFKLFFILKAYRKLQTKLIWRRWSLEIIIFFCKIMNMFVYACKSGLKKNENFGDEIFKVP